MIMNKEFIDHNNRLEKLREQERLQHYNNRVNRYREQARQKELEKYSYVAF